MDLDGNGTKEIIAKHLAGGHEGGGSVPVFTYTIHKVIDGKVTDVSDHYKAYYKSTLLPKMKTDLARVRAQFTDKNDQQIIDAAGSIAQDDYRHRILKQRTAGLENARVWVRSANRRL